MDKDFLTLAISCVSVQVNGIKTTLDLAANGDNVLDAAIDRGVDLPFSCKVGVCGTCKARLIKGKVKMDENHYLTDEEVADGMILTCQSHPITDIVVIDYDID
ncbi:2Fe-2S iron-sulfur cluster-binding protein [Thalassotalea psychrophila]|uniref:2Fe-2S iron-sulfur cluster-binding protein n=1 Tax=Thalassotalea psychrophila TaxID=3065647 RepID=A0ABY9TW81_9GAMM|nr:2Fe-2S iron-sulfur cluster-binding protein [Colwelliaceae bacterium SQ149]